MPTPPVHFGIWWRGVHYGDSEWPNNIKEGGGCPLEEEGVSGGEEYLCPLGSFGGAGSKDPKLKKYKWNIIFLLFIQI